MVMQLQTLARKVVRRFRQQHAPYPVVRVTSWDAGDGAVNFGDQLSRIVVMLMLAGRGMTLEDEAVQNRELVAVGSVMHLVRDGAAVWGTGVNGKLDSALHKFKSLDVRAVRGPRTRRFLMERGIAVPEIYGDPGLLIGRLAGSRFKDVAKTSRVGFVPNLNDIRHGTDLALPPGVKLISPLRAWHRCVRDIVGCELVLASSLHGLVVAEAFGIPARFVRLSEHEHLFKYWDYYEGTGRSGIVPASSIAAAMELGGEVLPMFHPDSLMAAFPWDLWQR